MLIIRKEQMEVFQTALDEDFVVRLSGLIREEYPEDVADFDDEELHDLVRDCLARAERYGLTWESSLTLFVVLMFEIAPNFDRQPHIQLLLRDPNIPPDERIDWVVKHARHEDWADAIRRSDENAWHEEQ